MFVFTVCRKLRVTAWGKIPFDNIRNLVVKIGRLVQKVKKRNTQIDIKTHTHTEQRNYKTQKSTLSFPRRKVG